MSTKYKNSKDVPNEILAKRLEELSDAIIARMSKNPGPFEREFTCRIPAECDRDADLVLSEAASRLVRLDYLQEEIGRLRALEGTYDTEEQVMNEIFLTLNKLCGN